MIKRFLLFSSVNFEPKGGWGDFVCSFDLEEEAFLFVDSDYGKNYCWWWHIVDLTTGKIVRKKYGLV